MQIQIVAKLSDNNFFLSKQKISMFSMCTEFILVRSDGTKMKSKYSILRGNCTTVAQQKRIKYSENIESMRQNEITKLLAKKNKKKYIHM